MTSAQLEELPALGAVFGFSDGAWGHLKRVFREEWLVLVRSQETPAETSHIGTCRTAANASRLFHLARVGDCDDKSVTEIYRWAIGGWKLVDRAPSIKAMNLAGDTSKEFVWSQDGQEIGLTWSDHPGLWSLMVIAPELEIFRDPEDDDEGPAFIDPPRARDCVHTSRAAAVAAAQGMFPEMSVAADDDWPKTWAEPVLGFRKAEIAAQFYVETAFIGPTDTTCTAPGCSSEAVIRIGRSGSDVGAEARLGCTAHAGEALARQL